MWLIATFLLICLFIGWTFKRNHGIQRRNLQIRWNAVGKDVVILHQFPRGRFCPSPSPYPLKLETFLRLHKIKYVNDFDEPMSDKNKSPWITINGVNISDSQLIIEFLTKKFHLDSNPGLSPRELIIARALRFMLEQDLYWALAYDRWVLNKARHVTEFFAPIFPALPRSIEAWLITTLYSGMVGKQVYAQGMGRHTPEEVQVMGMQDLHNLSDFLGGQNYMFGGEEPTELDCVLFGFMCMFMYCTPKDNVYVQKILKDHQNLVRFTERMKQKLWPDWNDCLYKD